MDFIYTTWNEIKFTQQISSLLNYASSHSEYFKHASKHKESHVVSYSFTYSVNHLAT